MGIAADWYWASAKSLWRASLGEPLDAVALVVEEEKARLLGELRVELVTRYRFAEAVTVPAPSSALAVITYISNGNGKGVALDVPQIVFPPAGIDLTLT